MTEVDIEVELINTLRLERLRWRLTQADIARAIGSTQQYISDLERAQASPRLSLLQAYAAAVGLHVEVSLAPDV